MTARHAASTRTADWWRSAPSLSRRGVLLSLLIAPVAALIALLRVGSGGLGGVVWAEDGTTFLGDAYARGGWHVIFSTYAGYLNVSSRMLAAVVSQLPIGWHGVAVNLAGALLEGCVACFAFHVVRSHTAGLLAPGLTALSVVLLPVGGETVANIANVQWFLLFAGGIAPLWTPRGLPGRLASLGFMVAVTTSCPFGALPAAVAGAAWWLTRSRFARTLASVGVVGTVLQAIAITQAPPRTTPIDHALNPVDLAHGYIVRVLGDGVFGIHFHEVAAPSDTVWSGLAVLAVVVVLATLVARARGKEALLVPALLLLESVVAFAAPVAASGIDWPIAIQATRYYVAPTLFLVAATALLLGGLVSGRRAPATRPWLHYALGALVLGGVSVGWVTSYQDPAGGRNAAPAWGDEVEAARSRCGAGVVDRASSGGQTSIRIAPSGWVVNVPCARVAR